MALRTRNFRVSTAIVLLTAVVFCGGTASLAQNSGVKLALHANDHATASDVGLPGYPGATPYKEPDNDAAFDMGFSFGDSQFRLIAANFLTSDSPEQVLAFYRKPLSRYGEVLECDHGKPVGSLTVARGGLTCSDQQGGDVKVNGHGGSDDHELRAGTPHKFRVVGIDKSQPKATHFGLVYIELPKDQDSDAKSK